MTTMSNDPTNKKFKKWLDILQQESWQLELIISGFAIYGLFLVVQPIEVALFESFNIGNVPAVAFWGALFICWFILAMNLLAHVVLRGLWIGAIGLRYVSGDIDYEALNYSPKFKEHLKKRVGSFDSYVAKLEKYCSVIFAITFLLVFYLLGVITILFILGFLENWMGEPELKNYKFWIGLPGYIFMVIGLLLTFIDFITQGWLKKKKWTTRIYYPFYWVFKYLTLSFLYRPIVYNLLDTRFGKRLVWVIVPMYIAIAILAGTRYNTSNYIDDSIKSSAKVANDKNYDEMLENPTDLIDLASIPAKVITDVFLKVFIEYGSVVEDDVFYFNENLKPEEDGRGLLTPISFNTEEVEKRDELLSEYVVALEEMYRLKIDSIHFKSDFVLAKNKRNQKGYETFLNLKAVLPGKHLLEISRKTHKKDSVYFRKVIEIPFWYYPQN